MAEHSIWEVSGVDKREFSALLILLRTVTGGRLSQTDKNNGVPTDKGISEGNLSERDECDGESRSWTSRHMEISTYQNMEDDKELKKKFLDYLAEFISPDKDGYSVTCSAMAETEEEVDIWLAKNTGFSDEETLYLTAKLAPQITAVATSSVSNSSSRYDLKADNMLWKTMTHYGVLFCNYNIPRLQEAYTAATPLLQSSCQAAEEASAQEELVRLIKPCEYFDKSTDSDLLIQLITSCYNLSASKAVRTFLCSSNVSREHQNHGCELWEVICVTGRLRAAYFTFCKAAERLSSFQNVKIHCVKKVATDPEFIQNPLSWQDALKVLSIRIPDMKVTLDSHDILAFNKWSKDSLSIHAETQLLNAAGQQFNMLRYIGGSKRACFMCWLLLCSAGFQARGCNEEIYSRWTMGASENDDYLVYRAGILKAVYEGLLATFSDLQTS